MLQPDDNEDSSGAGLEVSLDFNPLVQALASLPKLESLSIKAMTVG
jgi:hypothetical protein